MPSITSISPDKFDTGKSVTLTGSGFGASQGQVLIAGQAQTVTSWSDTSITFTTVRGSQSLGACRVDVVGGAGYLWAEQYLTTGLDTSSGLTANIDTISGTPCGTIEWLTDGTGGFARFTRNAASGLQNLQRRWSSSPGRQILVSFDIRRNSSNTSKQLKGWYGTAGTPDVLHEAFTNGPQFAGYTGTEYGYLYNDGDGGADISVRMDGVTGAGGNTSPNRTPLPTQNYNFPARVYQETDNTWHTYQFWLKANDPYDTANGEFAFWKDGVLLLHWKNLFNTANNTDPQYRDILKIRLFEYSSVSGFHEDYRNFKIGFNRPAELA